MKKVYKHTIDTAQLAINNKNLDFNIKVVSIEDNRVILLDEKFGQYYADIKSLCSLTDVSLHKERRRFIKQKKLSNRLVNTTVKNCKILEVLYGPDLGYKNRSFYLRGLYACGHENLNTLASFKHKGELPKCASCIKIFHGFRGLDINGERKKRTPEYNYWVANKKNLLSPYKEDFISFKNAVGPKPSRKAIIEHDGEVMYWKDLTLSDDQELNLISMSIRQAFRHSNLYKECLNKAKVETDTVTKYRCAHCGNLFKFNEIQVDHVNPIKPINGMQLKKEDIIDTVWTDKIQVLDKKCHYKKSQLENKQRREYKKKLKERKVA